MNNNEMIQELLTDENNLKRYYRFISQNPHFDLYEACQILIKRQDATVCFSFNEWKELNMKIYRGSKGIMFYDKEGNRNFVFDANDTYGDKRYVRDFYPLKRMLDGLDIINNTKSSNYKGRDFKKILSGIRKYHEDNELFLEDKEKGMLISEGVACSLYFKTAFPKDEDIKLHPFPYDVVQNLEIFSQIKVFTKLLLEEIEDAFLRKENEVELINDVDEDIKTDEVIKEKEKVIVSVQSAMPSIFKDYDVFSQFKRDPYDYNGEKIYIGLEKNYDNKGNYDNFDNSLVLISKNPKVFSLLSGAGFYLTQQEMLDKNLFSEKDYKEFNEIITKLSYLEQVGSVRFGVKDNDKGIPFQYPLKQQKDLYEIYKEQEDMYPDSVVLLRVGDFYEVLGEKAEYVGELLDLIITSRDVNNNGRLDMVGFPYHVKKDYLNKLLENVDLVLIENNGEIEYKEKIKEENTKDIKILEDKENTQEDNNKKDKNKINQTTIFDLINLEEKDEKTKLIESELIHGSGFENGKFRIYDKYKSNLKNLDLVEFIKNEYGIGGWNGPNINSVSFNSNGFQIENIEKNIKLNLSWNEVVDYIGRLIEEDRYLNEKEQEEYLSFKEKLEDGEEESVFGENILDELSGKKHRYKNNIKAIKLIQELDEDNRPISLEERQVLVKYLGWGGLSEVVDEHNEKWQDEYNELKSLLNEEEYKSLKGSVLNAFYTSKDVIEGIYKALLQFGVKGNNKILEPALGTGNFFMLMPKEIKENAKLYGVEIDNITGKIASKLYPNANIQIKGYEQTSFSNNSFDIIVTNVPYGNYSVYDSEYFKYHFFVHDYFIAKSIDKLRPNGIMAIVTIKGTMDKKNNKLRKYVANRAELIGAIRLPNTAFKRIAATEVVADILFFKKRENIIDSNEEWLEVGMDENGYIMNNYFISHPEMILGNLKKEIGLYGIEDITVKEDGRELKLALEDAIKNLPSNIYNNPILIEEKEKNKIEADYNVKSLNLKAKSGKIYMRVGDEMVEKEVPKTPKDAYERIEHMIALREKVRYVLDIQLKDCGDETLTKAQTDLSFMYDKFVKKYGFLNSNVNYKLFKEDGDCALLCALENISEDKKSATKADIFTKRTIRPYTLIQNTDDTYEALEICRNEYGKVDIEYIEELTNKDYDLVLKELGNAVFRNPNKVIEGDKYSGFETNDEYLSGEVVKKLKVAEQLLEEGHKEYERNVKALKEIQPEPLKANEISVKLGASWIDKELYKECLIEMLDIPYWAGDGIEVFFNPHDGSWKIERANYIKTFKSIKISETYGTSRANAFRLYEDLLNQKDTKIFDLIEEDGIQKRVLNHVETIAAREKKNKIQEFFKSWIYEDSDRRHALEEKYNSLFNQIRLPQYDGSYLKFPQMNPEIELRPHQKNAVSRIVLTGNNTLLHHVVGSGKTLTMICAGMKLKQYGVAKKCMYVVPNHLVQQWSTEFRRAYPNANILILNKEDLVKAKRKQFVYRVALGDWDGIIIAQSCFAKIPISKERQEKKIRDEIKSIEESIEKEWFESNFPKGSVKQLEKIKKSKETELKRLLDDKKKDDVLNFEDLGVDYLFVDESDAYKNLYLFTKMNNVAGISNCASQRALDLELKIDYINELHGGDKGVVFATGTPISNSMAEMYTLETYLSKRTLQNLGISYFDSWAADFGEVVTSLELSPSGQGYRAKTRFAKFTNLPELLTLYRSFADVQTSEMVKLDVPKEEKIVVNIKPSENILKLTEDIALRAEKIYEGGIDPHIDNMLKITNDGKKLALDPRCYDNSMEDEDISKLNECAKNIFDVYENTKDIKGTQLVFSDFSTPKKPFKDYVYGEDFDAYNDLKYKLIQYGIDEDEIAYIHEANNDLQKQSLFDKVNNGDIRILIGSTEKCGAGTNVQKRLVAIHHLDAPYRPRDFIQRNGRGIRQGNINESVQIFTYVTERTFDSYSYQILENKQRFISQIDRGDIIEREAEDIDEATLSYAEIKAITSANPKIKKKMELDNELQQLKVLEGQYKKNLFELQDRIYKDYPEQIQRQRVYIDHLKKDIKIMEEHLDGNSFQINIEGIIYKDKKEGGRALLEKIKNTRTDEVIGEYCGFKISLEPISKVINQRKMYLNGNGRYELYVSSLPLVLLTRIDETILGLKERLTRAENMLESIINDSKIAEEEVNKPFSHIDRMREVTSILSKLNAELDLNKHEEIIIEDEKGDLKEDYLALPKMEEKGIRRRKQTLNEMVKKTYLEETKKDLDAYVFVYDKGNYFILGEKAQILSKDFSLPKTKDGMGVSIYSSSFDNIAKKLIEKGEKVKVVELLDFKEDLYIEKLDILEYMNVDLLPDYSISQEDMHKIGYLWDGILPIRQNVAKTLFKIGLPIYKLNEDNTEEKIKNEEELGMSCVFGIEKDVWHNAIHHNDYFEILKERQAVLKSFFSVLNNELLKVDEEGIYHVYNDCVKEIKDYDAFFKEDNRIPFKNVNKKHVELLVEEYLDKLKDIPLENYNISLDNIKDNIKNNLDFYIQIDLDKEIESLPLNELEEILDIEPFNFKEEVKKDIEKEYEIYYTKLLSLPPKEIINRNFKTYVYSELKETILSFDLEDEYYVELYNFKGSILNTLYYDFISREDASLNTLEDTKDFVISFLEYENKELLEKEEDFKKEEENESQIFKNIKCKIGIEKSFRENELKEGTEEELFLEFGKHRVMYVLANTIQQKSYDNRFLEDVKIWANKIEIKEDENDRKLYILDIDPNILNNFLKRILKTNNLEDLNEMDGENKKVWLKAQVAKEALIKQMEKHSFMRMPENCKYSGYTYNIFNSRIKEVELEEKDKLLEIIIGENETILIRKGEKEVELSSKEFLENVDNTFAKDYERHKSEDKWTTTIMPQAAVRRIYKSTTLLAMPNNSEFNNCIFYLPNSFISESKEREDGSIEISLPETFEIKVKNRETSDEKIITPTKLYEVCNLTNEEDYDPIKNIREKSEKWEQAELLKVAEIIRYERRTLLKMPNGKYSNYLYYVPNVFLEEDKKTGEYLINVPKDFEFRLRKEDGEVTIGVDEYLECIKGKTKEDYYTESEKRIALNFGEDKEKRIRDNVPKEMQKRNNWCAVETRKDKYTGRLAKKIINCNTGEWAESDNPLTWTSLDEAIKYVKENGCDSVAYALDGKDNIFCIDVDHCIDEDGNYSPLVQKIEDCDLNTYCEKSISGRGLHYFGKTKGLDVRTFSKDGDLEFYQRTHFITMTGDIQNGNKELKDMDSSPLRTLCEEKFNKRSAWKGQGEGIEGLAVLSDREVVERAINSKYGDKFKRLYEGEDLLNDHSRSDMSLMARLVYWCNGDKEQMLRIFATSGLYRPEKTPDYYEGTAIKSILNNPNRYSKTSYNNPNVKSNLGENSK